MRKPMALDPADLTLHRLLQPLTRRAGGCVTSSQVPDQGGVPGQMDRLIAAGLWVRRRRGVYSDCSFRSSVPDCEHLVEAAAVVAALDGPTAISHISALRLLGLPTPPSADRRAHITRRPPRCGRVPRGSELHVAAFGENDVVYIAGVRVITGARLVLDCWQTLDPPDALAVADAALARGLTTLEALKQISQSRQGVPRTAGFERIIERVDPLADNWFESMSRWWLLEAGLDRPELQVPFHDSVSGRDVFVDMFFRAHGTVGEADGAGKYTRPGDLVAEKVREDWLRSQQHVEVVRWMPAEMQNDSGRRGVIERFHAAFARFHSRSR